MEILSWKDSFLLGMTEFDDHHRHLAELLNKTHEQYTVNPAGGALEAILLKLADYATYHFQAEERWMEGHGYPHLDRHRKEHDTFTDAVAVLQKECLAGQCTSAALFFFLAEWFSTHVLESDADYARKSCSD